MTALDSALIVAIAAGVGTAVLFLALIVYRRVSASAERREQVLRFAGKRVASGGSSRSADAPRGILPMLDSLLTVLRIRPRMAKALERAGLNISPARWSLLSMLGFLAAWLIFGLLLRNAVLGLILALVVAIAVPRLIVSRRESARKRAFEEDLPEFFLMMASALRSGLSFSQALESVARDGASEVDRQMRRAVTEVSMGVPPEEALAAVAERMDSEDMRWAVVALSIQKEVGGNLSMILDSVAETVRTRADVDREVRTLSAEGRLSALVLVSLPIVIFLILALIRPDYVTVFWSTNLGRVMLAGTVALFAVGLVWMRSIVRVRV